MHRRKLAALAGSFIVAPAVHAWAQGRDAAWPNRPIRIVVGFAAGGVADIMARLMAPKLSEALGQPVVVDNKPGASSAIAAEFTAQAPPDGHTIMLSAESLATAAFIVPNLPYRPLEDFAFVTQCGYFDHVILVSRDSPLRTFEDFIAAARARPGHLNVGAVGPARVDKMRLQGRLDVEAVSFRTTPDLLAAISNGNLDVGIEVIAPTLPLVQSGVLRPLATTGRQRSATLAELPTATERGVPYVHTSFNGIIAPRRMPEPIVMRFNAEFHRILVQPDIIERFGPLGVTPRFGTPADFEQLMRDEIDTWKTIMPMLSPA